MKIWLGLLLLLCVLPRPVRAEFSGRLRFEEQSFFQPPSHSVPQTESSVNIELEKNHDWNEIWGYRFEPRLRLSSVPSMVDSSLDGDFRDTFIEAKANSMHFQFGSFIKVWEGTDGVNPMDIASVKNLRDPFSGETLGSWGMAANGGEGLLTWDLLYVPWQTLPRVPGDNSAWWPRHTSLPLEMENQQLLISADPIYQVLPHAQLNSGAKDNYGGRLQYHGDGWDASAAYFEGLSQVPIFRPYIQGDLVQTFPKTIVQMENPIRIEPIDYRRRTLATGLVYTRDSWVFRAATRHDQPLGSDPLLPGWQDQSVIGLEKTLTIGEQSVIVSVLYSLEQHAVQNQSVLASADPFESAILSGVRWPLSDEWLIFWMGFLDTKHGSNFNRLSLQRKIGSSWSVEGSVDRYAGPADTMLGMWAEQSRARLSGVYSF